MTKHALIIILLAVVAGILYVTYTRKMLQPQQENKIINQPTEGGTMEKTFAIIKPDAVKGHHTGEIIKIIEKHGFKIIRMEKIQMSKDKAKIFYAEHSERPFFGELVDFITSGPIIIMALEKENAVKAWRDLMGATDPKKAEQGTIRNMFGASIGHNAVHGSDAHGSARRELDIFFPGLH